MSKQTNALDSYSVVGHKEDIENIIYNVSPEETPVLSMCTRVKATNRLHQFQKDTLAAGAANQQLEGDVFANADLSSQVTTLQSNDCQISYKVIGTTGTEEAIPSYGRGSQLDYQIVKKGKELKKDIDHDICANVAKVAGDATTARKMAGLVSWIATNADKASDGTDPTGDGTDARTAGTARAFTEDLLLNVLETGYGNGAKPNKLVVGAFNKKQVAGFAGGSTRQVDAKSKAVYASVDVYYGPYGEVLDVIPSRQSLASVAMLLDDEYLKLAVLRPMEEIQLAKVADTDQRVLITECTLVPGTELAHGIVADLSTS